MKRRLSYMMVILSAVALASCNQEVIQDNNYGYLGVSLDSDFSEDILTKADADELVFSVDVLNASGKTVASREDHRTITKDDPIKLQVGTYTVAASSGENLNAAFDNPYYEGKSDSFRINPNKTTSVNLTCTLANTIVSVEFPGDFSKFTDYEVAVTNGKGDKLVFSNLQVIAPCFTTCLTKHMKADKHSWKSVNQIGLNSLIYLSQLLLKTKSNKL
jgi:hypothetical protein